MLYPIVSGDFLLKCPELPDELELELLDLDLRDTVEDVARLLSIQAHEKGLEITVQIDPKLPDFKAMWSPPSVDVA